MKTSTEELHEKMVKAGVRSAGFVVTKEELDRLYLSEDHTDKDIYRGLVLQYHQLYRFPYQPEGAVDEEQVQVEWDQIGIAVASVVLGFMLAVLLGTLLTLTQR